MCQFCENEVSIGYDGAGDGIYIERGEDVSVISCDSWEIEINYCPMCGRRFDKEIKIFGLEDKMPDCYRFVGSEEKERSFLMTFYVRDQRYVLEIFKKGGGIFHIGSFELWGIRSMYVEEYAYKGYKTCIVFRNRNDEVVAVIPLEKELEE